MSDHLRDEAIEALCTPTIGGHFGESLGQVFNKEDAALIVDTLARYFRTLTLEEESQTSFVVEDPGPSSQRRYEEDDEPPAEGAGEPNIDDLIRVIDSETGESLPDRLALRWPLSEPQMFALYNAGRSSRAAELRDLESLGRVSHQTIVENEERIAALEAQLKILETQLEIATEPDSDPYVPH